MDQGRKDDVRSTGLCQEEREERGRRAGLPGDFRETVTQIFNNICLQPMNLVYGTLLPLK